MKRIGCRIVNGVKLRLFKEGYDDGTGKCPIVPSGEQVTLAGPSARDAGTCAPGEGDPSITMVSDAFWKDWVAQNKGKNPLFDLGHIYDFDAGSAEAEWPKAEPEPEETTDGGASHV